VVRLVDTSRKQAASEDPVTSNLTEPSGNLEEARNAGETEKDASEGPDQGLARGGLPDAREIAVCGVIRASSDIHVGSDCHSGRTGARKPREKFSSWQTRIRTIQSVANLRVRLD
jgi:hypothetical protein